MQQYPGFEGDIEQWYFQCGDGTWTNDPTVSCEDENEKYCEVFPPQEDCVQFYSECDYQGTKSIICNDAPFTDIDFEVKSILLDEGQTVYLYNMPCWHGETAAISQSITCIDTTQGQEDIDFQQLLGTGIRLMSTEDAMKEAPGAKQATYRKPTVTKATNNLKEFRK